MLQLFSIIFLAKKSKVEYNITIIRANGKTVKCRCGPAAVTGDENRDDATISYDGKAR